MEAFLDFEITESELCGYPKTSSNIFFTNLYRLQDTNLVHKHKGIAFT